MERWAFTKVEGALFLGVPALVIAGIVTFFAWLVNGVFPSPIAQIITVILIVAGSIAWTTFAVFTLFWVDIK